MNWMIDDFLIDTFVVFLLMLEIIALMMLISFECLMGFILDLSY